MCMPNISIKVKLLFTLMAPLLLSVPASAEIDNCCFVGRQCDADREWVNGYWAYQNNQCASPSQQQQARSSQSQPQTGTSAAVDNCCFVDRLCTTGEEWVSGYWAFQNNECAAPSQQQQSSSLQSQPQPAASSEIDNCCFLGWQCASDDDWVTGYWAYQNNQCAAPSQRQQPQARQDQRTPSEINNCCFIGWQCDADEEWRSGYWAFQANQCDAPAQWQSQWQQMKQQQRNNANQQSQNSNQRRQPERAQRGNNNQAPQVQWETEDWHRCIIPCPPRRPGPVTYISMILDISITTPHVTETDDGTPVIVSPEAGD